MSERYLGVRGGIYLLERDGRFFQQFNDGGWQEKWVEQEISDAELHRILRKKKAEYDRLLPGTDTDQMIVPSGVTPIWKTSPRSYYEWHATHDPEPHAAMAQQILDGMQS